MAIFTLIDSISSARFPGTPCSRFGRRHWLATLRSVARDDLVTWLQASTWDGLAYVSG